MTDTRLSKSTGKKPVVRTRKWVKPASLAGLIMIIAMLPLFLGASYMLHILILTFVYIVAAVSFRTIVISGQFSIAHAAFMGIGAYVAGMTSKWLDWSPWFTIPLGGIAAMVIGIITGYPFSRLRAIYYAMGSLFFGVVITSLISTGGTLTGGYSGLAGVHPIFIGSRVPYYYLFMGLALLSIIALYRFEFSRIGVTLKAIAQSHLVASSIGINESRYRILAVGVGCFFVGLVGAAYAHYNMVLSPSSFNLAVTLWIIMYVLIGGIDSFAGPIVGTVILFILPEFFRGLKSYSPYISAGILIIIVYLMPKGLVGLPQIIKSWFIERRKGKGIAHAS
jgi:branched-chain amino acid transport system permease protein